MAAKKKAKKKVAKKKVARKSLWDKSAEAVQKLLPEANARAARRQAGANKAAKAIKKR